jgi:predicted amidohydrolase
MILSSSAGIMLLTAAGSEVVTASVEGWNVGLSVCYDLRFPELYQAMRFPGHSVPVRAAPVDRNGVEMILVPSAFACKTGAAHWEVLLRARAIETQCYVIAAAQSG